MEVMRFTRAGGATRGRASTDLSDPLTISYLDARGFAARQLSELTPQLLNELNFLETSHFDLMPWLRAILLVSPQPSDALALSVMERGVVLLEAPREHPAPQVIEAFLQQTGQFQTIATTRGHAANQNPSSPSTPGHTNNESEFSRTPAFNQALYGE